MKKIIFILSAVLSLQGCIFVAGAAAGAAAVAVVNDHRSINSVLKDNDIANHVSDKIQSHSEFADSHIDVTSFNRVVLMTGEVSSTDLKEEAGELAAKVPHIQHVYNELNVTGTTSTLTRASDSWITAKIKTLMLANRDLKASAFKVLTENGTVYLMGNVTHEQGDMAADVARQVNGVQKVVKVFHYTN